MNCDFTSKVVFTKWTAKYCKSYESFQSVWKGYNLNKTHGLCWFENYAFQDVEIAYVENLKVEIYKKFGFYFGTKYAILSHQGYPQNCTNFKMNDIVLKSKGFTKFCTRFKFS